jgi:mono/diheme cytochrome c family protein
MLRHVVLSAWLVFGLVACNQQPADVREWRPSDHDNTENPQPNDPTVSDGGQTGVMGVDEVAIATWRSKCIACHGLLGRGDGPRGASMHVRDLADPAWQATVTDAELAQSIKNGKGQMPRNDFPDSTVKGLVRLVRLLNASRAAGAAPDEDGAAEPARAEDAGVKDGGARDAALRADAAAPKKDGGPRLAPRADSGLYP